MEKKERLQLLLAYGFLGLFFGFVTVITLTTLDFPFKPESVFAVFINLAVFGLSFYLSATIVSKYMYFSHDDVRFIQNLTFVMGLVLIGIGIVMGMMSVGTFFSNISFLAIFLTSTQLFLKPKTENAQVEVQPYAMLFVLAMMRMFQVGYRWVNMRLHLARSKRMVRANQGLL